MEVADTFVGESGTVEGVADAEAAALVPFMFEAVTEKVYTSPLVSPVKLQKYVGSVVVHCKL